MNTTTKWILGLVAVNVALLPFTFPSIGRAAGRAFGGWLDCCQETAGGAQYCCVACCWLTHDCIAGRGCGRAAAPANIPLADAENGQHDR